MFRTCLTRKKASKCAQCTSNRRVAVSEKTCYGRIVTAYTQSRFGFEATARGGKGTKKGKGRKREEEGGEKGRGKRAEMFCRAVSLIFKPWLRHWATVSAWCVLFG